MHLATSLEELVAQGRELLDGSNVGEAHSAFRRWDRSVASWLDSHYPGTGLSADWSSQGTSPLVVGGEYYDRPELWAAYAQCVVGRLKWLGRLGVAAHSPTKPKTSANVSRKAFVVHGRDAVARESVARFLKSVDIEPVILHEQPNEGRTIVEKFEKYSDVGFAVVVLTADDTGQLAGAGDAERRARQNVILELGFFLGRLGRANKVCPLYEAGVTLPSDYEGVVYVPLDEHGGWKMRLAKELTAAGLPVDLNRAV
jgi:predicted nucleotide-binding protein